MFIAYISGNKILGPNVGYESTYDARIEANYYIIFGSEIWR
jgi:hypothetical protein